jgi:hypothetical protein
MLAHGFKIEFLVDLIMPGSRPRRPSECLLAAAGSNSFAFASRRPAGGHCHIFDGPDPRIRRLATSRWKISAPQATEKSQITDDV